MASITSRRPVWASEITSCTPGQAALFQGPQKRRPKRAVLAVTDVEAEDFAAPVGGHPGGDHHRLRHHPVIDPGLAIGGVEEHIREPLVGQGPIPERGDLGVQVGSDPRDLALRT